MDNTESGLIGAAAGFVLAMIISMGFIAPGLENAIREDWCVSDGGTWKHDKCFEDYKERELK